MGKTVCSFLLKNKEDLVNKINSSVRINELDGLSDSIVRFYNADENAKADTFLARQMVIIEDLSAKITAAVLRDRIASSLCEKDKLRTSALSTFGGLVRGYRSLPDEEKKSAAKYLAAIYSKYAKSRICSANYKAKSSLIESLLGELSSDESVLCIGQLDGVEALVSSLRSAQDAFAKESDSYTRAVAARGENATSLKRPLLSAINGSLVPYLTTMTGIESSPLEDFSKSIETEINKVNLIVMARAQTKKTETA